MAIPGVHQIELAGLRAWPGLEAAFDGNWIHRAANGYTKRANSVQSLDPADDDDAAARLERAAAWFRSRNLPPVFRITPLAGPRIVAALDAAGWSSIDHSHLLAMELQPVEPDSCAEVLPAADPGFLSAQQRLCGYDTATTRKLRAIVENLEVPAIGIVARAPDRRPVASGLMAIADGMVITGNVVTATSERRQGHAGAVMRTGLAWAIAAGARIAALNVQADNGAALALYGSLGYARRYDYSYRRLDRR